MGLAEECEGREGTWHPLHIHTQRDDYPQPPAARSCLAGLVLDGSCPLWEFPWDQGSWPESALLGVEEEFNFPVSSHQRTSQSFSQAPGLAVGGHLGSSNAAFRDPNPFRGGIGVWWHLL